MVERLHALLVEDNEDDCALVLRELRRGGYDVAWERVETPEAMQEALARENWDIIFSDFRMPRFSAPEVVALYRKEGLDIPLIIVSGTIGEEQAVESLKAGAHDFLLKDRLARLCPAVARELREAEGRRARRSADARYRLLVEQMPAVLYIASAERVGEVLYASPQVEALFGFPAGSWLSDPEQWFRQTHPEDRARVRAEFERLRAARAAAPLSVEYRMQTRAGNEIWIRDEARFVAAGERTVARVQGMLQNVTELRRAQVEMARQRETLHQTEKIAVMGQLLAGVAHELNNPLSVVLGQGALLRRELAGRAEEARAERIEQAATRCARIVRSFLALARQQPPSRAAVAIDALIGEVVDLLVYTLRVDGIEFHADVAPDLPVISADGHQLQQVLINLVSNAHHALKHVAPPRRLSVSSRYDSGSREIVIDVEDNGPGIPGDVQARMFEPFFTTKPLGEGTGLGLSLCRGIVEGHGGTISVASPPGPGTLLRVRLPTTQPAEPALAEAVVANQALPPPARILVVDDEAAVAELLADILGAEGHDVQTAQDGPGALVTLGRHRYDLVLADMRMPGLGGGELFRETLKQFPHLAGRFIFLTGDTLAPDTAGFLAESGQPYLAKPFNVDDVVRLVRDTLRGAADLDSK
jgi:PAS domain S-box-containing protein